MSLFSQEKAIVGYRGIHLDLKGTPPTFERLLDLLKVIAAARYNAVLVEWEDMFPWTVDERFRSETAYSEEEVRQFHAEADRLGLAVIPLVQCLGHMQTPLSLAGYEAMREVPHRMDVLNPLAKGARELVQAMVDDVLRLTPGAKYLHLGGDEAWSFGTHPDTKAFIAKYGPEALYLQHIEPILDSLNKRGIRPILWHDMMRDWSDKHLQQLAKKADLCVWGYNGHPDQTHEHFNTKYIQWFRANGVTCWGGAAYKGADGQDVDLPVIENRETNALAWAQVAQRFGFVGIFATAWSRYSTGGMQCEPIDGALDALVAIGVILHDGKKPAAGLDGCLKLLERLGEKDRFNACHAALAALAEKRQAVWRHVLYVRELYAGWQVDPQRESSREMVVNTLKAVEYFLKEAHGAAEQVQAALDGLMQELWVQRYLAERIAPLDQEFQELTELAKSVYPFGYKAEFGE